ncbi:MAG: AAA family ATPase [Lachnospiraceae bacterium]|nr:AAA family ATPase [Lachnospiraceae bacterium]
MKNMAIMIGIQASGKSTFSKKRLSDYTRINLDTLKTRNKEATELLRALLAEEDIVIDNTNPAASDRLRYIEKAKKNGYKIVGYFMQSKLKDCLERNERRTGTERIINKAIAATSNKLEMPSYEEGFDELYFVSIVDNDFVVEEWR